MVWDVSLDYIGVEWENPPEIQMSIFDFPEYLPGLRERGKTWSFKKIHNLYKLTTGRVGVLSGGFGCLPRVM